MTPARPRGSARRLTVLLAVLVVTGPLTGIVAASADATTPATAAEADVDAGTATAGNVATIEVWLPDGTDAATLSVGDRDLNFGANATLHDRDGDGTVTVALDTARAGNGNASSYLSARGADGVTNATQRTDAFDGGLDPASYGVILTDSGGVLAEGTLFVEADGTAGNESATASFDYEGERLTLVAADNRTVRGETSLAPGSDVTVVLEASGDGSAEGVRWTESYSDATVAENGTFGATFDLAGYGSNTTFEARLVHRETVVASAPGRLAACERRCLRTDEVRILGGVEVDQNRTARIPITFGSGDRLNVTVTNTTGPDYRLNATVRDTDGDDRATLLFRTAHAGDDEPTLLVREGNETRPAEVTSETTPDRTLPAALYLVEARTPGEPDAWDTGTLVVFESSRPPTNGTATPAPGSSGGDEAGSSADAVATSDPETPDPLEVRTTGSNGGVDPFPLASVGLGGLIAIGGFVRLLRR